MPTKNAHTKTHKIKMKNKRNTKMQGRANSVVYLSKIKRKEKTINPKWHANPKCLS